MYLQAIMITTLCLCTSLTATATAKQVEQTPSYEANHYELVLYINPRCPYCVKVTQYLEENNRVIPTKNTSDPLVREELIRIGGKSQVPCLVINGKALYESNDIIEWLKAHP